MIANTRLKIVSRYTILKLFLIKTPNINRSIIVIDKNYNIIKCQYEHVLEIIVHTGM